MLKLQKNILLIGLLIIIYSGYSANAYGGTCDAKIFSVKTGLAINWNAFIKDIQAADIVAIGEEHGVKAHVDFAACLINQLENPKTYALVVEQITSDKQGLINAYRKAHPEIVSGLGKILHWWQTGWPAWHIYLPLFNNVWQRKVKLYAGDMPNVNHSNNVTHSLITYYKTNYKRVYDIWKARLHSVYCGHISAKELEKQVIKQMLRDQHMRKIILNLVATNHKVLFYAGRNHVNFNTNLINENNSLKTITITLSGASDTSIKESKGISYFAQLKSDIGKMPKSIKLGCK